VLWLLIAESFFITGYATVLNSPEIKNATMEFQHQMLFWVLPIAALIAGILAFLGVVGSARRVGQLRSYYDEYERRSGEHDASTVAYPPLQPEAMVDRLSRLSLYGLPILFVIIWIAILLSQTLKGGL
jgi:cytochrome c-type biogenesis protein CcmH/NrfF